VATYTIDTTNPLDNSYVAQFPSNERNFRAMIAAMLGTELSSSARLLPASGNATAATAYFAPNADAADGNVFLDTANFIYYHQESGSPILYNFVPPGAMLFYGVNTVVTPAPAGWVACDGANYPNTGIYHRLSTVIGTVFGTTGAGNFNVPDLRGCVPMGFFNGGDGSGDANGADFSVFAKKLGAGGDGTTATTKKITIAQANLPNYALPVTDPGHFHTSIDSTGFTVGASGPAHTAGGAGDTSIHTSTTTTGVTVASGGSGTALNTNPRALVATWIISL